jgi:hypothetical protein
VKLWPTLIFLKDGKKPRAWRPRDAGPIGKRSRDRADVVEASHELFFAAPLGMLSDRCLLLAATVLPLHFGWWDSASCRRRSQPGSRR